MPFPLCPARLSSMELCALHVLLQPPMPRDGFFAAEVISRPAGSIQILKVNREQALDAFRQWLITGNDAADRSAKFSLKTFASQNNLASVCLQETSAIEDAFRCSERLHQCSLRFREIIKDAEKQTSGAELSKINIPPTPFEGTDPWVFQTVTHFISPTWDEKWLQLVQHYFTLLCWPSLEKPSVPVALMEIMLDLCVTFQVPVPVNLYVTKFQGPDVPVVRPKTPAKYFMPTPESHKQTSHRFLRTFDLYQSRP